MDGCLFWKLPQPKITRFSRNISILMIWKDDELVYVRTFVFPISSSSHSQSFQHAWEKQSRMVYTKESIWAEVTETFDPLCSSIIGTLISQASPGKLSNPNPGLSQPSQGWNTSASGILAVEHILAVCGLEWLHTNAFYDKVNPSALGQQKKRT